MATPVSKVVISLHLERGVYNKSHSHQESVLASYFDGKLSAAKRADVEIYMKHLEESAAALEAKVKKITKYMFDSDSDDDAPSSMANAGPITMAINRAYKVPGYQQTAKNMLAFRDRLKTYLA